MISIRKVFSTRKKKLKKQTAAQGLCSRFSFHRHRQNVNTQETNNKKGDEKSRFHSHPSGMRTTSAPKMFRQRHENKYSFIYTFYANIHRKENKKKLAYSFLYDIPVYTQTAECYTPEFRINTEYNIQYTVTATATQTWGENTSKRKPKNGRKYIENFLAFVANYTLSL